MSKLLRKLRSNKKKQSSSTTDDSVPPDPTVMTEWGQGPQDYGQSAPQDPRHKPSEETASGRAPKLHGHDGSPTKHLFRDAKVERTELSTRSILREGDSECPTDQALKQLLKRCSTCEEQLETQDLLSLWRQDLSEQQRKEAWTRIQIAVGLLTDRNSNLATREVLLPLGFSDSAVCVPPQVDSAAQPDHAASSYFLRNWMATIDQETKEAGNSSDYVVRGVDADSVHDQDTQHKRLSSITEEEEEEEDTASPDEIGVAISTDERVVCLIPGIDLTSASGSRDSPVTSLRKSWFTSPGTGSGGAKESLGQ